MGAFADDVRDRIRDALAERRPNYTWDTEHRVRQTPIDVVGTTDDRFVAVELEWRRADPANNTAKLFYYRSEGDLAAYDSVTIVQVFTGYYDLQSGGVSSKREVAEFVGQQASDANETTYHALDLDIHPPTRGGARPAGWTDAVEHLVADVDAVL